jgi:membrane-associated HD superfamily phosphohydrolase
MYRLMSNKQDYIQIVIQWASTGFYILIGGGVKLAYASKNKSVSKRVMIITFVFAAFAGVIVNQIMIINGWVSWSGIATSIGALMGESIVTYLLTNSNNIFRSFINAIFKIDVKDDHEPDN